MVIKSGNGKGKDVMYCKYCGKKVSDQVKFCPYCGKPLEAHTGFDEKRVEKPHEAKSERVEERTQKVDTNKQNQKKTSKKMNAKTKKIIIIVCCIAIAIGCISIGIVIKNVNSSYSSSSDDGSTSESYAVLLDVIDRIEYYDDNGLYYTEEYNYNDEGLINKIDEYGKNLNDTDERVLTYQNHQLISIKDSCPTAKDDTIIYKYEYDPTGNHYLSKRTKQLIPGSDSDSKEYTNENDMIYRNKNKKNQKVYQKYYKYNDNEDKYLGTYEYNKKGYITSLSGQRDDQSEFTYNYTYDSHGTIKREGYEDNSKYYKYTNQYDHKGRLIKYAYSDTNDDDYTGVVVQISYKQIDVNSKLGKSVKIQQQYYLHNGKYYDEAEYNYMNDLAQAYS